MEAGQRGRIGRGVLLPALIALLLCLAFIAFLYRRYPTRSYEDLRQMELQDAELSADGRQLRATGDDPGFYFPESDVPVLSVRVDIAAFDAATPDNYLLQLFYYMDLPQAKNSAYALAEQGANYLATELRRPYRKLRLDTGYREGSALTVDRIVINEHNLPMMLILSAMIAALTFCYACFRKRLPFNAQVFGFLFLALTGFLFLVLAAKYPTLSYLPVALFFLCGSFALMSFVLLCAMVKSVKADRAFLAVLLLLAAALYLFLVFATPFGAGPDERMRFDVVEYIARHGRIPRGDDPEIRDAIWGASYAFQPLLPYLISGWLCRIVSFFTKSEAGWVMIARLFSLASSLCTVYLTERIARRVTDGPLRYALPVAAAFLPSFVCVSSYVSTEAFAFFAVALVIYFWISGIRDHWKRKDLVGLSVAMALCLLSYKNAYGPVLISVPLFFLTIKNEARSRREVARATALVVLLTFTLAGWWFIRNGVLYNGDLIGGRAWNEAQALYGSKSLEEQYALLPANNGLGFADMLVGMEWYHQSFRSLISGNLPSIVIPRRSAYKLYEFYYLLCLAALVWNAVSFFLPHRREEKERKNRAVFAGALFLTALIPLAISFFYSYYSDFQPQGRYLLPGYTAFLFLSGGSVSALGKDIDRIVTKAGQKSCLFFENFAVYCFAGAFLFLNAWFYADAAFAYYRFYL